MRICSQRDRLQSRRNPRFFTALLVTIASVPAIIPILDGILCPVSTTILIGPPRPRSPVLVTLSSFLWTHTASHATITYVSLLSSQSGTHHAATSCGECRRTRRSRGNQDSLRAAPAVIVFIYFHNSCHVDSCVSCAVDTEACGTCSLAHQG